MSPAKIADGFGDMLFAAAASYNRTACPALPLDGTV
jgi:hypothetical protein